MGIKRTLAVAGLAMAIAAAPVSINKFGPKTDDLMAGTKIAAKNKKTAPAFENQMAANVRQGGKCEIDENTYLKIVGFGYRVLKGDNMKVSSLLVMFVDKKGNALLDEPLELHVNETERFKAGGISGVITLTGLDGSERASVFLQY